jgi:hypothetical protein
MSDGRPPLVLETPGGLSVRYGGRLLYSGRDPTGLPRRIASRCDPGPARLHLVPSPLLWYGIPELLAAMGEDSALLCVEADPLLAEFARAHMPAELRKEPRLAFLESSSPEEAVDAARGLGSFRACSIAALSGGEALASPLYKAMAAALGADFEALWRNRAALMILGPRWARNIFDNLALIPAIAPLSLHRFGGPVAVCGAGPSLESALPLLAACRRDIGVVACDTALGSLLAAGIEPDLVVCLEGQAHNLADFTCLGSRATPLVADLSSHPASFRLVQGPKYLTLVRITRSPFLSRAESALTAAAVPFCPAPPLGSVGVHAVHLAALLSRGPLLAAGLDFCFKAGKTHARGCPSLLAEERRLGRLTRWPSQYAASFRDRTMSLREGSAAGADARSPTGAMLPSGGATPALSDPILLSYAALLAERFVPGEGRCELYDLRSRGPSIGGRRISLAQAESLLQGGGRGSEESSEVQARAFDPGAAATSILLFLRDEERRLGELRLSMRGIKELPREEFRRLVSESDYLCWGFPDQDRLRDLPQDFLNRLMPQVEFWAARLAGLSASLEDFPGSVMKV